jgi:Zn-finger nucleic acid-binding protein
MTQQRLGEVVIDRCDGCGGLWLDALEKEKLLQHNREVRQADTGNRDTGKEMDDVRTIRCPRDRSQMIRMVDNRQPHVRFESCTVCGGVFLDAGELKDLSKFTLRERLRSIMPGR